MSKIKMIESIERAVELFSASGSIGYYHSRQIDLNEAPNEQVTSGAFGLFSFTYDATEYDEDGCEVFAEEVVTFVGILEEGVKHHITMLYECDGKLYAKDSDDLYMDDEASFEEYKDVYNKRSYLFSSEHSKIQTLVKFG